MTNSKQRNYSYDILRILACFFVVSAHVTGQWKYGNINTVQWTTSVILDAFSRWCLPVFFMLSGVLSNTTDIRKHIKKMLKILLVFIAAAFFYALVQMIRTYIVTSQLQFYLGDDLLLTKYHLWFLPEFFLLLSISPVLNQALNSNEKLYKYLLVIWFISCVLPTTFYNIFDGICNTRYLALFDRMPTFLKTNDCIGYFILGKYLYYKKDVIRISNLASCFIYIGCWFAIIVLTVIYSNIAGNIDQRWLLNNANIFVVMQTIVVFNFVNKLTIKNEQLLKISKISNYTFFIYIFHPFVIDIIRYCGIMNFLVNQGMMIPTFIKSIGITTIVFFLTLMMAIVCYFIKKKIFDKFK